MRVKITRNQSAVVDAETGVIAGLNNLYLVNAPEDEFEDADGSSSAKKDLALAYGQKLNPDALFALADNNIVLLARVMGFTVVLNKDGSYTVRGNAKRKAEKK